MPLTDDQVERYARHIVLREIGGPGQQKLLGASVLVVGAGGLGNPCALYLAAAGVGRIGLIDDDTVALSNLQRQILFKTEDVGRAKTEAAKDALSALNPDIEIVLHSVRLNTDNVQDLVSQYDIIADGSDNFETRFAVNDAALALGKPLVSAAVGQFDGQIATFKPYSNTNDGKSLPCYRCLVPEAPPQGFAPACADAGIVGALTGIIGSLQALEVIKECVGIGSLAGRLMLFDGSAMQARTVRLPADPSCPSCGRRHRMAEKSN